MDRTVFLLLILGHVLGDFYLQFDVFASRKEHSFAFLLLHGLLYGAAMMFTAALTGNQLIVLCAAGLSGAHFIIDGGKLWIRKCCPNALKNEGKVYLADQTLHIACILAAVLVLPFREQSVAFAEWVQWLLIRSGLHGGDALSWLLLILLIIKPCSVTVRKVLVKYRPSSMADEGVPNAGALIGVMERCIILLMLSMGQYAAIGLVLTAKSVARYKRISDDPQFSEYYLLGTLLSTLLVIMGYRLLII